MNRKAFLIVATCAMLALFAGCGGGSKSSGGGGGGGGTPPAISIAITTAPASTVEINNTQSVAATVSNDSSNAGVDWACSPSPCGTFNPTHTDSGASTTWTAPSTASSVTLTADATAMSSVTATASVTVNSVASNSNLSGQYAFYLSGYDLSTHFYAAVGSVTLDGNGNVTTGEEDLNDTSFASGAVLGATLTGTYTVNGDGQGTMTLNASSDLIGADGVQTLSFVVVNSSHLLIEEFDTEGTSSGSMDLQTSSAFTTGISGNYAIAATGFIGGEEAALGGVYAATSSTITATGTADEDIDGTATVAGNFSGTITSADVDGRGTFTLTTPSGSGTFSYYIVGPEAVYLIESDAGGVMVGQSFGQGSGTFSASSISGTNVFIEQTSLTPISWTSLCGQFTSNGTNFTGVADYNLNGIVDGSAPPITYPPTPSTLSAPYSIASSGYGSMTTTISGTTDVSAFGIYVTDPALNINDPNNASGGGGALLINLGTGVGTMGGGFIVPQSATALTTINEADSYGAIVAPIEPDEYLFWTGQFVYSSSGFAGTANVNDFNLAPTTPVYSETSAAPISGVITADTTNVGRYNVVLTLPVIGGGSTTNNRVQYVASAGLAVGVDVDTSTEPGLTEIGSEITEGQQ